MSRTKGANGYTAEVFLNAIPGTRGVLCDIARKIGCSVTTVRKYRDRYVTVAQAILDEKQITTDIAQNNIIKAIEVDGDIQTSKWWLQLMDQDFIPKERREISGPDGEPILIKLDR